MLRFVGTIACVLVLACAGCGQTAATQLIVVVDTDYAVPSELDAIQIDVQGTDGVHHVETQAMPREADLPYSLSVVPAGSSLGPVQIEARGQLHGTTIVSHTGRVMLVAQQTLMVELDLDHACDLASAPSCATDHTCAGGVCVTIDVPGQTWTGLPMHHGPDAGPHDAGPMPDGQVPDAGSDAGDAAMPPSDAGPDDAWVAPVDAGHDTGPVGCANDGQCDDGNPCTDDACNGGNCTHANNTVSCGATTCGAYGVCDNATDACTLSGTQSRSCTDHVCANGSCNAPTRMESAACTRAPQTGVMCGATTCGAWSTCGYVGNCHPTTMQSRTCTDYQCDASGGCVAQPARTEMQACPQAPTGTDCTRPTQCGTYTCSAAGICTAAGGQCRSPTPYCCADIPGYCVASSSQCFL